MTRMTWLREFHPLKNRSTGDDDYRLLVLLDDVYRQPLTRKPPKKVAFPLVICLNVCCDKSLAHSLEATERQPGYHPQPFQPAIWLLRWIS